MPVVKVVSQIGYGVSIFTLVVAFFVLLLSKRLRCPRNTLHMHLFVSFILRASMALLKDSLFVQGVGLPSDVAVSEGQLRFLPDKVNWACKLVTSIWQFCIMVNYSWILMEGLYLHNLIFMALFTDSSAITLYVLLGWGLPVLVVVPWVVLRATLEDHLCWTTHEIRALYLVIRLPIIASVLLRKWARSTLVLMPLFGVHYSLSLGMAYWLDPTLEMLWIFFDQLFASFQGFLVSLLYCLLNGEVRAELARVWHTIRGRAACSLVTEDSGVSSLLVLSRLQLARSRGTSLPELQTNGRASLHAHPNVAFRVAPPVQQAFLENENFTG
ncbi:hypothetical protein B566_EDAN014544 [Ephemera danica]|nr:hypothetical protein B566_EDAN014544 [Ephemera danica]